MANPPIIGSFRTTANNAPREASTPASEVSAAPPAPPEVKPEEPKLTPAEQYAKLLKENDIELKDARAIVDEVIVGGFYEESFKIAGRKVTFRTRTYADQLRVNKALELENPTHAVTYNDIVVRHNLAASLAEWAGNKYPVARNEEEFQQKLDGLKTFSAPLINLLSNQLAKFDAKMLVIFSDGCLDSF